MGKNTLTRKSVIVVLGFILFAVSLYLIIIYAPTEREMGIIQKNFYLMVPYAWLAMFSYLIIFISSILYLSRRTRKWDMLAHSAAELGFLATTLTLIIGILWMRPIWGVWWTWEPRLTATLILWFIYIAYLMVRSFAAEESRGARFAAVVGIIGFVDIPIIGMATTLWRVMHPPLLIFQGGLAPQMLVALIVTVAAYTVFYFFLLNLRYSLRKQELDIRILKETRGRV